MFLHVFESVCFPGEAKWDHFQEDRKFLCPTLLAIASGCRRLLDQKCWSQGVWWAQVLLDRCWELLNTGPWREVPLEIRRFYSYASLLKVWGLCGLPETTAQELVSVCDLGLIMGGPIFGNILTKLAAQLSRCTKEGSETSDKEQPEVSNYEKPRVTLKDECRIPQLHCPSVETFREGFYATGQSVVLAHAIDYWPAMNHRRWSLAYLKKVGGSRMVPVELGSRYTDGNWTQELMTIGHFIDKYILQSQNGVAYLAQHQLFEQIPELRNDISIPTYCCVGTSDDVDINAWFGPSGTVSPLHFDPKHNFLAQVVGYKYVRLYSEECSASLYPYTDNLLANTSQVDVEAPDQARFPSFCNAPYTECVLAPGQLLYIPPRCWHFIRSLSLSFSVSFWWE